MHHMSVMELDMPAAPHFIPLPPCRSRSSNQECTGQGGGGQQAAESRFRTILFTRRCFFKILWQTWKKKPNNTPLVFHIIPLGAILYHFAKNWICPPKSSTAIGSARVWSAVAATLTFSLPYPLPTHPLPLFFSFMWIYLCLI